MRGVALEAVQELLGEAERDQHAAARLAEARREREELARPEAERFEEAPGHGGGGSGPFGPPARRPPAAYPIALRRLVRSQLPSADEIGPR